MGSQRKWLHPKLRTQLTSHLRVDAAQLSDHVIAAAAIAPATVLHRVLIATVRPLHRAGMCASAVTIYTDAAIITSSAARRHAQSVAPMQIGPRQIIVYVNILFKSVADIIIVVE